MPADLVFARTVPTDGRHRPDATRLDDRTASLVHLGALTALAAPPAAWRTGVAAAREAGASDDEILAVLDLLAPSIGLAATVAAAPALADALGYDIDGPLERTDP